MHMKREKPGLKNTQTKTKSFYILIEVKFEESEHIMYIRILCSHTTALISDSTLL